MGNTPLSQDDIDALSLQGATGASTDQLQQPDSVQLYDFRRPRRVSKERLRALEAMYERLVKSFEGWLLSRMRGQAECKLQRVEQLSFGEYQLSLPAPCAAFIVDVADSGGQQGVLNVGTELAFYSVDRTFGGHGTPQVPDRTLTAIERHAIKPVAEKLCALVCEIWRDYVPLTLEISGFETFPEILQAANADDPMLVTMIECTTAGLTSLVSLALPFAVLDKFFVAGEQRRVAGTATSNAAARLLAEQALRRTGATVTASLPAFTLALEEIAALAPGTELQTGIPIDTKAHVFVEGQHRFSGILGRAGRNVAVNLTEFAAGAPSSPALSLTDLTDTLEDR